MGLIKAKGLEFKAMSIRDSFGRKALKFKNDIISNLNSVGIGEDDVFLDLEPVAIKKLPAEVSFYVEGEHLHFSWNSESKYVENLYVVSKVIELKVKDLIEEKITPEEFVEEFKGEEDDKKDRKEARKTIGVEEDCMDLEEINKKYKSLAKTLHPDMSTGDVDKFKELNKAHKILKRELE